MPGAVVNVNGFEVQRMTLHVPHAGAWWADLDMMDAPALSGRVTLTIGQTTLSGTVDARADGTQTLQRRTRIVGGAGGWGVALAPKDYANDLGVQALRVAQDAAREAGETLGGFVVPTPTVGAQYVRQSGPAARVLEDVTPGALWWVDYDGVTQVGARATSTPQSDRYQVLDFDPRTHVVTFAFEELADIPVGATLTASLDAPQTVRDLEVQVTEEGTLRARAWCGGTPTTHGRLAELWRRLVARATDDVLFGKWRYRVIRMSGDRVELQAISVRAGLPNVLPIPMRPGVAGVHAQLTPGTEVYVEFIEGSRAQPVISGFAGRDGAGFVPARLELANAGPTAAPAAAREGDTVEITFDAGTFMTSAQSPVYNSAPLTFTGTITSGSTKVGIG